MAVIAPFLQRQLYDDAVTQMADELRLKANILESSDSDTTAGSVRGASQNRRWSVHQQAPLGGDPDGSSPPPMNTLHPGALRRRRRKLPVGTAGAEKVSNWLLGSTDWSRQFQRAPSVTAGAAGQRWSSRHSAGAVARLLTTTTISSGSGSGSRGTRHHVVQSVHFCGRWWLRLNLRGRLEVAFPVVAPMTARRTAWDIAIVVLVLYSAVTVPLAFSYGMPSNKALAVLEWLLTVLYAMDMCLCFRTGYYNADGNLVRDSWPVARQYMVTWFPIDLLATVPFDAIGHAAGLGERSREQLMVLAVLKTPRLLRLIKLMRMLDRIRNANAIKVLQLILLMMMIAHWLACIWYIIARFSPEREHWGFDTSDTHDAVTWYLCAYYYSFLLLIGDNVSALNNYERVFFIFALILGACFYSAVVGNMALLVANMNIVAARFRQKLDMTMDALRYMRVPEPHIERVQAFYDYITTYSHPGSEGMGFLSELTKGINEDLHMFLHSAKLRDIYLFKDCEPAFIRSLGMRMKVITFIPCEVIFRQGNLGQEMYIIRSGCVAVVSRTNEIVSLLQAGDFFGEIALLTQSRRTAKCVALSNCDLAVLSSFDLKVLMKEFPHSAHRLQAAARERLRQLQIAGRAGLLDDEGDGEGEYEEDEEVMRAQKERREFRRLRNMSIAPFATGRAYHPNKVRSQTSLDEQQLQQELEVSGPDCGERSDAKLADVSGRQPSGSSRRGQGGVQQQQLAVGWEGSCGGTGGGGSSRGMVFGLDGVGLCDVSRTSRHSSRRSRVSWHDNSWRGTGSPGSRSRLGGGSSVHSGRVSTEDSSQAFLTRHHGDTTTYTSRLSWAGAPAMVGAVLMGVRGHGGGGFSSSGGGGGGTGRLATVIVSQSSRAPPRSSPRRFSERGTATCTASHARHPAAQPRKLRRYKSMDALPLPVARVGVGGGGGDGRQGQGVMAADVSAGRGDASGMPPAVVEVQLPDVECSHGRIVQDVTGGDGVVSVDSSSGRLLTMEAEAESDGIEHFHHGSPRLHCVEEPPTDTSIHNMQQTAGGLVLDGAVLGAINTTSVGGVSGLRKPDGIHNTLQAWSEVEQPEVPAWKYSGGPTRVQVSEQSPRPIGEGVEVGVVVSSDHLLASPRHCVAAPGVQQSPSPANSVIASPAFTKISTTLGLDGSVSDLPLPLPSSSPPLPAGVPSLRVVVGGGAGGRTSGASSRRSSIIDTTLIEPIAPLVPSALGNPPAAAELLLLRSGGSITMRGGGSGVPLPGAGSHGVSLPGSTHGGADATEGGSPVSSFAPSIRPNGTVPRTGAYGAPLSGTGPARTRTFSTPHSRVDITCVSGEPLPATHSFEVGGSVQARDESVRGPASGMRSAAARRRGEGSGTMCGMDLDGSVCRRCSSSGLCTALLEQWPVNCAEQPVAARDQTCGVQANSKGAAEARREDSSVRRHAQVEGLLTVDGSPPSWEGPRNGPGILRSALRRSNDAGAMVAYTEGASPKGNHNSRSRHGNRVGTGRGGGGGGFDDPYDPAADLGAREESMIHVTSRIASVTSVTLRRDHIIGLSGAGTSTLRLSDDGADDGVTGIDWVRVAPTRSRIRNRVASVGGVVATALSGPVVQLSRGSASTTNTTQLAWTGGGGSRAGSVHGYLTNGLPAGVEAAAWLAAQAAFDFQKAEADLLRREAEVARREAEVSRWEVKAASEVKSRQEELAAKSAVHDAVHQMLLSLAATLMELMSKVEQLDERLDATDAAVLRIEGQNQNSDSTHDFLGLDRQQSLSFIGSDSAAAAALLDSNVSLSTGAVAAAAAAAVLGGGGSTGAAATSHLGTSKRRTGAFMHGSSGTGADAAFLLGSKTMSPVERGGLRRLFAAESVCNGSYYTSPATPNRIANGDASMNGGSATATAPASPSANNSVTGHRLSMFAFLSRHLASSFTSSVPANLVNTLQPSPQQRSQMSIPNPNPSQSPLSQSHAGVPSNSTHRFPGPPPTPPKHGLSRALTTVMRHPPPAGAGGVDVSIRGTSAGCRQRASLLVGGEGRVSSPLPPMQPQRAPTPPGAVMSEIEDYVM